MTDPDNVSTWLAVIAIAVSVQALVSVSLAIGGLMAYRRTRRTFEAFRQQQWLPIVSRVHHTLDSVHRVLDDAHDVAERVKSADDHIRTTLTATRRTAGHVSSSLLARTWPAIGIARGAIAAFEALRGRRAAPPASSRPKDSNGRLAYEGGR